MTDTEDTELATHLLRCWSWAEEWRTARTEGNERRSIRACIMLTKHRLWMLRHIAHNTEAAA